MRRPNFFILGAPKCGTTSLYDWLKQHPRVFMPDVKEPHFFNTDDRSSDRMTLAQYERLFDGANEGHLAVGESSVWYLASKDAVPAILDYSRASKFIACVRNPVEMAYALHSQQIFAGQENMLSFSEAWRAQDSRERGAPVPIDEPRHLLYGPMCKVGGQIERLISVAGRDRVHLVFLEDMKRDAGAAYRGILQFLGLPEHRPEFRRMNEAKGRRSLQLRRFVRQAGRIKRSMGIDRGFGLLGRIDRMNTKPHRWQYDPSMTDELRDYFREDIQTLARISGRDLSHWLASPAQRKRA